MSFTNFYANKPGREIKFIGLKNYIRILNKEDIWETMQATAHFMFWTLLLQAIIGLGLALLLKRNFKGSDILTTLIVLPMMLSPAVVAVFWTYMYQPQSGIFNYIINYFFNFGEFTMIGDKTCSMEYYHSGYLDVDSIYNAHLSSRIEIDSKLSL